MTRAVAFFVILLLVGLFALVNWDAFAAPTPLSLGVTTVHAPLGFIMLALVVFLCVLFIVWVISLQGAALLDSRRQTRELQAQRDLADSAEASRFTELRTQLMARLDAMQHDLRTVSEQNGNAVAAQLGQLEDRLERGRVAAVRPGRRPISRMKTGRLEAFSDGVLAIIITIMVLDLKVPHGASLADVRPLLPVLLSYLLSFVYVGIYWSNHHHMIYVATKVTGTILWANLHLLFWLSLLPFATGWMGENHLMPLPTAAYGAVLCCSAIAYWLLQRLIIAAEGDASQLGDAVGSDWKGKVSPWIYLAAIGISFQWPRVALGIYVAVAMMWFVPERRIEAKLEQQEEGEEAPDETASGRQRRE